MTVRSISALLVTGALGLAGVACDVHVGDNGVSVDVASGKATQEWSRSYTVASGAAVGIVNTNGSIEVESGTTNQVEIKAVITARAGSEEEAQTLIKKVTITETVASPKELRLETTVEGGNIMFGRRSANVEYHIKVPAGLVVSVKTENGGIGLRNVSGTFSAATTNGGVRALNLSGAVSAHCVNGGITLDVARVTGPIEADVVNGGVGLQLPADINADLDAHAVNGGVVLTGIPIDGEQQSRTQIAGHLNKGGIKITAGTVNGGVRIAARSTTALKNN